VALSNRYFSGLAWNFSRSTYGEEREGRREGGNDGE